MAKLVDASASGADTVTGVEVRVLFRAPKVKTAQQERFFCLYLILISNLPYKSLQTSIARILFVFFLMNKM